MLIPTWKSLILKLMNVKGVKMKDGLRAKLETYCQEQGWGESKDDVLELLSEAKYDAVEEYGHDEHRWYTLYNVVVKFDSFFVDFVTSSNSGDEPAFDKEDADKMIWDSAVEVFPTEVKVIKYVTKDKL